MHFYLKKNTKVKMNFFSSHKLFQKILIEAAQVCTDLMLQDDDDDYLTRALGLNACYNYYLTATEEDFKSTVVEQEDEDIVKVKVQFVRNLTNDDHFDLIDKRKLLGKTIAYLSRDANNSELISLQVKLKLFLYFIKLFV